MRKKFQKAVKGVREFVGEVGNEVLEKPQFYKDVEKLISELDALSNDRALKKDPDSKDALAAAGQLKFSLEQAKNTFDQDTKAFYGKGMHPGDYNLALHAFAKASVSAIHEHQTTLMAAPGVWNKLKAAINNVLESWLNIKDALGETKVSKVGMYGEFKNRFEKVKDDGKEKIEDIESKPFGPHNN
ncbi:hypothetical protein [Legionella tucsonensis]|uniref:Uncharacterized protein n=1 Tax=Legionella tucsonensis TaxID=40335 RepID=A0A0W0ZYJ3_9GAMM|nr:hypothetical protein [Legionella tucsonensis]KTD74157.1 hypothetical protein Ltuc_2004 [Legionella tucsonensis]